MFHVSFLGLRLLVIVDQGSAEMKDWEPCWSWEAAAGG